MLVQPDAECPRTGSCFQHGRLVWPPDTCGSSHCFAKDVVVFKHLAVLGLQAVELDAAKQTSLFIIHARTLNQL